jgi:hypothetical protein
MQIVLLPRKLQKGLRIRRLRQKNSRQRFSSLLIMEQILKKVTMKPG